MNSKYILTAAALAGIITIAAQTVKAEDTAAGAAPEAAAATEKCYGVVQSGKNDCGASGHSCAGHATEAGNKAEWIKVPAGLCEKLVGGSLAPVEKK